MGGSDDPSNIALLSVQEHAEEHKKLWEKYGKKEDYLAWKGLEGCISLQELFKEKCRLGGLKSKGRKKTKEELIKLSNSWTAERKQELSKLSKERFSGKRKSPEHIEKMKNRKLTVESLNKMRNTQINNNYGGKKVKTPEGVFQSIKDCNRHTKTPIRTISYRAKNNIKGYSFVDDGEINGQF